MILKKAAIIVVNWNGKRFLKNCLQAVFKQTYRNFDVYFVDNGSIDKSAEYVAQYFTKVKIIRLDKNYGFSKGNNVGIKEAFKDKKIEYVVCLNNDTIVSKNWLKELIKTATKDEKIGSVSSKAYFPDGKTIQTAGLFFTKSIQSNSTGGVSIGYGKTDKELTDLSTELEIFAAGGVAPLYKRKILEHLYKRDNEIFDEDFFAYVEDFDLGFRIRKLGFKSFLSPKAKIIHLHSQTGGKESSFKSYYCERNSILTAIKNLPPFDLILFPIRNLNLKLSYLFKKNESFENFKEKTGFLKMICIFLKADFAALLLLPKMLIKRWKIKLM
jgi:hypothetical protein